MGVFLVQNFPAVAIVFPFMTLLCIPGRLFLLPCFFEGWELLLLDGEDQDIEEWIEKKENFVQVNQLEAGEAFEKLGESNRSAIAAKASEEMNC